MDEQIVRAVGADVYNGVITGDIACTLNANTGGGRATQALRSSPSRHGAGSRTNRTGI